MEAQAVQFWYGILDKEVRRRICHVTLMNDDTPTLAHVFALSEKIKFNMVEEKVVTSGFSRDIATTPCGQ
jgi:phosphoribosylaminoimidazole carboxylase (NCAIR synthetase)